MRRRRIVVVLGVVCALLWATGASASVTVKFTSLISGQGTGTIAYWSGGSFVKNVTTASGGHMSVAPYPDTASWRAGVDLTSNNFIKNPLFCLEIPENIAYPPSGPYTYGTLAFPGIVPLSWAPIENAGYDPHPMGDTAADLIKELWTAYYSSSWGVSDKQEIGAFQAAIWKLEYDAGSTNWTTGNVRTAVDGSGIPLDAELALTDAWIKDINTNDYELAGIVALADSDQQDFVGEGTANWDIPEPVSLIVWTVLGAGAAGLALRRRRRGARWSAENRQAIQGMIEGKLQL